MNTKDCEHIGYILSEYRVPEFVCEALFTLDARIESEYIGFLEVRGIFDEIKERSEGLAIQKGGRNWALGKNRNEMYAKCMQQAKEEIYGKTEI